MSSQLPISHHWAIAALLQFIVFLPAKAAELKLLAATKQQADAVRQQLLTATGSYLTQGSTMITTASLQSFKREYPAFIPPPARPDDILYLYKADDGLVLSAEILTPKDSLLLLLARLDEQQERYKKVLQENKDSAAILYYAYLAYNSGQFKKAKALLHRARNLPLSPKENVAARELSKFLSGL